MITKDRQEITLEGGSKEIKDFFVQTTSFLSNKVFFTVAEDGRKIYMTQPYRNINDLRKILESPISWSEVVLTDLESLKEIVDFVEKLIVIEKV